MVTCRLQAPSSSAQRTSRAGSCCTQGDNLFQLLGARFAPDPTGYMLLAALVMIPTVWLPDQKALSYLGFCGIAATLTVSAAVVFTFLSGAPAPSLAARLSCS